MDKTERIPFPEELTHLEEIREKIEDALTCAEEYALEASANIQDNVRQRELSQTFPMGRYTGIFYHAGEECAGMGGRLAVFVCIRRF